MRLGFQIISGFALMCFGCSSILILEETPEKKLIYADSLENCKVSEERLKSYLISEFGSNWSDFAIGDISCRVEKVQIGSSNEDHYKVTIWMQNVDQIKGSIPYAVKQGQAEAVKKLIGNGAQVDQRIMNSQTGLMIAAEKGYAEIVHILIAAKADLNAFDENGETALFKAAKNAHMPVIEALLAAKADPNRKNKDGRSPLMICARSHSCAKALIRAQADVNATDNDGVSVLDKAIEMQDEALALELINAKVDLRKKDRAGRTPLMNAVERANDVEFVKALLTGKPDLNAKDSDGTTALGIALRRAQWLLSSAEIAELLKRSGAKLSKEEIRQAKIEQREQRAAAKSAAKSSANEGTCGETQSGSCSGDARTSTRYGKAWCENWRNSAPAGAIPHSYHPGAYEIACSKLWTDRSSDWLECVRTWDRCASYLRP